jgi:predicted nucleic acid-binding protein
VSWLLDTNVISELQKRSVNLGVREWFDGVDGESLYLSTLVVGEIRQGIERLRRRDHERAIGFEAWLSALKTQYRDRVIAVDAEIAEEWGRINAESSLPAVDGLLAATALVRGLTLVTRNVADVERTGVPLLNPFVG